jgi:hypothetical protein
MGQYTYKRHSSFLYNAFSFFGAGNLGAAAKREEGRITGKVLRIYIKLEIFRTIKIVKMTNRDKEKKRLLKAELYF